MPLNRRSFTASAVAVGAVLLTGRPADAARAVVDLPVREAGFPAPPPQPAGPVTLRVTTTNQLTAVGLLRLHDGVPLERVIGHIRLVFSDDPLVVVEAGRAMMRDTDQLGTATLDPGTTVTVTAVLAPGRYHLVDYHRVYERAPGEWIRPLDVLPHDAATASATAAATIVLDEPRFHAPVRMRAAAPYRVINAGHQPNEAVLMPVRPGTTRADLQAFFTALDSGSQPPTFP
ncbi:MAG: hypothetical protein ACRDV2_05840, partial [Actinomycetes bacterium]